MMRQYKTSLSAIALLLAALLLPLIPAHAQNFVWVQQMGGTDFDSGRGVATDAFGNVYTTGEFNGTADFDGDNATDGDKRTSFGESDVYLAKHDSDGNFQWVVQMGGASFTADTAGGIAVDGLGNVYTTGQFAGTADFDGVSDGNPGGTLFSFGESDVYLTKHDSNGTLQWVRQMGGPGFDAGEDVATDAFGNVYTTGSFRDTADFDPVCVTELTSVGEIDVYLAKHDSNGTLQWVQQMGGPDVDRSRGVATDLAGNVYTTGQFSDTADFGPGFGNQLTSFAGRDVYLSKHDTSGTFQWVKQVGGIDSNFGLGVATDAGGSVYTTGVFNGTADFDPPPPVGEGEPTPTPGAELTSFGEGDVYLTKHDTAGNFLWVKQMGGVNTDIGWGLATDAGGSVYTTGSFSGTADFDADSPPAAAIVTSIGGGAVFLTKHDSTGNFLWVRQMSGPQSTGRGFGVTTDALGNVYTTGDFTGSAMDFDAGKATAGQTLTSFGNNDIFLTKMMGDSLIGGPPEGTSAPVGAGPPPGTPIPPGAGPTP